MSDISMHEFYDLYKKYSFNDNDNLFQPIWHYTSVDGLTGIIQDNKNEYNKLHFWFTRSDCLYDTSEGSNKEDSLDMWRYYAKDNGGYGLKLTPFIFDSYKEYEYSEYNEKALFVNFWAYQNANASEIEKTDKTIQFLQFVLQNFQYQFKHQCFASEEEYRFVVYLPYSKPETLKNELPTIKFRTYNGIVVPYIDLIVENGSQYLTEVLISPYIKNENALATTSEYLEHCGFLCKTRLSQLPVRK